MANSNEKFKVKFGLAVGDTAATIDASTGNISTTGKLTTTGAVDLVLDTNSGTNSGSITIADGVNGDITIDPNGTGKVIIAGDLQVDGTTTTINSTTLDVDDKNITLAKGAANAAAADGGGITLEGPTTPATLLYEDTDDSWNFNKKTTATELQIDNININGNTISSTDSNGAVIIAPNGSGSVQLTTNTTQVGTGSGGTATITTNGANDIIINTNNGTNSGKISVTDGANADILLEPNGSGNILLTLSDGGNLVNDRNYLFGNIRNTSTDSIGDIWALNSFTPLTPSTPVRGISIDNSAASGSGKVAGAVLRNYSNTAGNAPRVIFERSRLSGSSPAAVASGDVIGIVASTGYSSTGWFNELNSSISTTPGVFTFSAAENWVSNTNVGTQFNVFNAPTATTITNVASLTQTIAHNPQTAVYRSDSWTFRQGKTGTTNLMTLDSSGNMVVTGDVRINGSDIQASDGNTNITLTSNTLTTFAGDIKITGNDIQDSAGQNVIRFRQESADNTFMRAEKVKYFDTNTSSASNINFIPGDSQGATGGDRITQFSLFHARTNAGEYSMSSYYTLPYSHGTGNYSAIGNNETLGLIGFVGNYSTTSTAADLGAAVEVKGVSAEAFTATNNGGRLIVSAKKIGGNTSYDAIAIDSTNGYIRSNNIYLQDNNSTALTSAAINYTRTFGEFAYTNAAGFAIAAQNTIYTMPLDTTLSNSGVTISSTGNININVAGWYKIIMSLQVTLTVSNQPGQIDFWLRKNGVDVANSKTQVDLLKDQKSVIAMDWLVNSDGNDYWEIVYVGTTANYADIDFPTIAATTTPYASPVAPALLVNVIPAGM